MNKPRNLRADEIEVRIQQSKQNNRGGFRTVLLLYKTARTDMAILDETFGAENWTDSYREIKGNLYCTISVWDEAKKAWVGKEDCGVESNTEAEKGEASDAFKRAGTRWGIGRELYTAPQIVLFTDTEPKFWRFSVKELGLDAKGNIDRLSIEADKGKDGVATVFDYPARRARTTNNATTTAQKPAQQPTPTASVGSPAEPYDMMTAWKQTVAWYHGDAEKASARWKTKVQKSSDMTKELFAQLWKEITSKEAQK